MTLNPRDEEDVLVFETSLLERVGNFTGFREEVDTYLQAITEHSHFVQRGRAEADPSFKQIIPYVLLRHENTIFRYKRTRRGEEERLHTKYSIGVGGHINPFDQFDLFAATKSVIEMAMEREVAEEVIIDTAYSARCVGVLNDDSNEVGRVHFGVVYQLDLAEPKAMIREKGSLIRGEFVDAKDLSLELDLYETWSQILIRSFLASSYSSQ